jgi:oligopeptide transport system substrate-binding protein
MIGFVKMRSMKSSWIIVLAIALAGCGKSTGGGFSDRKVAGSQNILRYCIGITPTTLDPAKVQDPDTIELLNNIYEPLVNYDEHNKIVGNLASEWKVSDDGTVYTFKLANAKFHDGSVVNAKDVKASWERALSREISSPIADTYLGDIVGAKEISKGSAKELIGVKVVDDSTIQVTIDKPRAYFLGKLCYSCCDILPAKQGLKEIASAAEAIGSGPFKVGEFKPEQVINLKRFDEYHGEKAKIDGIERKIVKDPSTRLTMYRNGETDICPVEKQDWKAVSEDPKLKDQFQKIPQATVYYLLLSGKAYAPFKDRHVRRAVMMAINRERIANEIMKGVPIADRWMPPGIIDAKPTQGVLSFDPGAARAEMQMSSFGDGSKLPELELTVRSDNTDGRFIAEQISNDLKNNLGLTVKQRALEEGALLASRNRGALPSVFLSWGADYLDAQNFLSILLMSDAPANFDKWNNPDFDKLCAAADVEKDASKRETMYLQAEGIMLQDVPRVPLYFKVDGVLVSPRVSGFKANLLNMVPHNKVTLK